MQREIKHVTISVRIKSVVRPLKCNLSISVCIGAGHSCDIWNILIPLEQAGFKE